jgi:hypothetical protein
MKGNTEFLSINVPVLFDKFLVGSIGLGMPFKDNQAFAFIHQRFFIEFIKTKYVTGQFYN